MSNLKSSYMWIVDCGSSSILCKIKNNQIKKLIDVRFRVKSEEDDFPPPI
jgi:hypothetical protein